MITEVSNNNEERRYWYLVKHGVGPGAIPKGLAVLEIIDIGYNTYVCLDGVATTSELREYEMKEAEPDGVPDYHWIA